MSNRHQMNIEGHTIVALEFNEDKGGIPAIFIHGISASIVAWNGLQTPLIDEQFHWYSLSLPGHYPAVFPENFKREELTAEMIASVLTKAIRELVGEQKVLLVGHSTGGFAVLSIAAHSPEIAAGIISIAGFAKGNWTGALGLSQSIVRLGGRLGEQLFKLNYGLMQKSIYINRPLWRVYAADSRSMYRNVAPVFDKQFEGFAKLDLASMLHYFSRMPDIDITDMLHKIDAPLLAIAGEKDPVVPPSQSKIIAETVQHGQVEYIPNVGHMTMMENPEAQHKIIRNWIKNTFM